jgi:adenosylmethionine-8-amino-7-oxononanoate aminotransferase
LSAGLRELRDEGLLVDVRGEGAVWGISVPKGVEVVAVRDALLDMGIIIRPILPSRLTLCPPLVITDEQIDEIVAAIGTVLRS